MFKGRLNKIFCLLLGMAAGVAACFLLMLWDSYRWIQVEKDVDSTAWWLQGADPRPDVPMEKLVGTWETGNYVGDKYTITRKADGTFTATYDFRRHDTGLKGVQMDGLLPIVKVEGYWAVSGRSYSFYFTKSNLASWLKRPPEVMQITRFDTNSISFKGGKLFDSPDGYSSEDRSH
jgi:hypothetical protein